MKHLEGRASQVVIVPLVACFAVLETVERYPDWLGEFVEQVVIAERDPSGRPSRAHVVVHVAQSPFGKRFEFDLSVRTEPPHALRLTRLPAGRSDRERLRLSWRLREADGTHVELHFGASASLVPGLLPLPGVGDLIARTLLDAAIAEMRATGMPEAGAQCSEG